MKLAPRVPKAGTTLYAGIYDITDAGTFGKACADAYSKLLHEQFLKENNVGGLMEHVENETSLLDGTLISIEHVQ